jgi:GNAT superfamily N-acetyltransferase
MSFWGAYVPYLENTALFISQPFERTLPVDSLGLSYTWIYPQDTACKEVCQFLYDYFGNPPQKPRFVISVNHLLSKTDLLLLARDTSSRIVGCIRYHDIGVLYHNKERIYAVDCFCIHPEWRGKGVGRQLLYRLHCYANELGIPHAVFLKEGSTVNPFVTPLYSGTYVYRSCSKSNGLSLRRLSVKDAVKWLTIYQDCNPSCCIIHNPQLPNQQWYFYKKGVHSILIGVQDTYQRKDEYSMGWVTAWLESPLLTDKEREEASDKLMESTTFDYLWMNQVWCASERGWQQDGAFHWYTYQWLFTAGLGQSYCLMH